MPEGIRGKEEDMVRVELMDYKLSRLDLVSRLETDGPVRLANGMDFVMEFEGDGNGMTEAVLKESIEVDGCPDQFCIKLEMEGLFYIAGVKDTGTKKEAHVKCYDELFPYANQVIKHLAAESGMPGLSLKKRHMDKEDISISGQPGDEGSGKVITFKLDSRQP